MSAKRAKKPNKAGPIATPVLALDENADELARLVTALDYADGFALFFARCNVPVQRRQMIATIKERLAPLHLQLLELEFTQPVRDLRGHLRRLLDEQGFATPPAIAPLPAPTALALAEPAPSYRTTQTPVIAISGLEFSLPFDQPTAPLINELNLGRELFRRDAPYALLFWLPDYAITAIARHAPDFWAWRSSLFTFTSPEPLRQSAVQTLARDEAGWLTVRNLAPEEKQRRARLLESLLDDYADLPDCPRTRAERADLLSSLGQINRVMGQNEPALAYYKRALQIHQEIGDKAGEGTTLNNISQIYDARGDYETALDYLERALKICQEIGDKAGEGTILNNISQIYEARGEYETALNYLERALKICQEIGDKAGEGTTLNNMATTAYARGDYETALDYLKRALKIRQEIGDKAGEGTTLNNISQIYDARGDYETALDYLERSLKIRQEIGDKAGEGTTLNNISQIYDARGDYETALDYLERSLKIRQEIGDVAGICNTLFNLGHIYYYQQEQQQKGLATWIKVYQLAKPRQLAQALQALEGLANKLGLPGGLAAWEQLAQQIGEETTTEPIPSAQPPNPLLS